MESSKQIERALAFRKMHDGPRLLLLPNAWDVVSAKLYEVEGFQAVGTTSAGISATLGMADGERMSLEDNLAVCRRIADRVGIPVSADLETGYSRSVDQLAETIRKVVGSGAVGINIEDSVKAGCGGCQPGTLRGVSEQCERIAAVRQAADRAGVPLFINARTDVLLEHVEATEQRLSETIERGNAYRAAGADCVFVPDMSVLGESEMALLANRIHAPLNLIAGDRTPSIERLEALGVARLSFGPRPMRAALHFLRVMAREWVATGRCAQPATHDALSYTEVNAWFAASDPTPGGCGIQGANLLFSAE